MPAWMSEQKAAEPAAEMFQSVDQLLSQAREKSTAPQPQQSQFGPPPPILGQRQTSTPYPAYRGPPQPPPPSRASYNTSAPATRASAPLWGRQSSGGGGYGGGSPAASRGYGGGSPAASNRVTQQDRYSQPRYSQQYSQQDRSSYSSSSTQQRYVTQESSRYSQDGDRYATSRAPPSDGNNARDARAPTAPRLLDEEDDDSRFQKKPTQQTRAPVLLEEDDDVDEDDKKNGLQRKRSLDEQDAQSSRKRREESDADLADETQWRDELREVQNAGFDAYVAGEYDDSKAKFERALQMHARRCKNNAEHFEKSQNRVPSRVHADRDAVRCKLLKYLAKVLEKLGDDAGSRSRLDEAQTIDNRLQDYERRKKSRGAKPSQR